MKLFYVTNIFDLHTFGNETANLLKCFEISTQMYFVFSFVSCFFVSLFFSKWRKYCSLTFEDTFKVFKVFANLNSSSINIPYLYGLLDVLFRFFRFVIYIHINVPYVKNFMKKLSLFNTNFQKSFQDVYYVTEYENVKPCDTKIAALWI